MNKAIIYENETGGVSIVYPAPQARQRVLVSEATYVEAEYEEEVIVQGLDEGTGVVTHRYETRVLTRQVETAPAVYRDQTDDEFLEMVANTSVPAGVAHKIVDVDSLPTDRTFRNAWTDAGDRVVEDVEKAKEVAKEILRAKRAPVMEALDVQFMRALEQGKPTAAIAAEKQRLRDITVLPDSAKSVEELKQIIEEAVP